MPEAQDNDATRLLEAWSSSTREMMSGYARFFAPEWLNQPILQGWRIGNTYIVSDENSKDPGMERRIVAENSYGRQLGRIMDALEVLVDKLPEDERKKNGALRQFVQLADDIHQIKERSSVRPMENLKADLESLKEKSPEDFKRLMAEFRRS